jgi:prefoldin subunit 5
VRTLIVHHGKRPSRDQHVTGGALRAMDMAAALEAAGHTVRLLSRAQDEPGGFTSEDTLYQMARAWGPERIICTQLEDATALAAVGAPIAVDLYAPRVMEAAFDGSLRWTSVQTLRALAAGDVFLVSNPRQRWLWWGLLAMAGVDLRTDPTLLVPLVSPNGPRRRIPKRPVFVVAGGSWAWQNPRPALERVLAHLDQRGQGIVRWYGGVPEGEKSPWTLPTHPRLETPGWVDRPTLLKALATATAAIDWMVPNPERQLAFSFRHAEYLGCGLPILSHEDSPLADVLGEAGWIGDNIEDIIDDVLDSPQLVRDRSEAARRLAKKRFSPKVAFEPLLDWVLSGARYGHSPTDLLDHARLAADGARAQAQTAAAQNDKRKAEAEVAAKRAEIVILNSQIASLTSTVDRLSRAIDEVAGFKREAITLLGNQGTSDRRSRDEAHDENAILLADVQKKSAELAAMDLNCQRLTNDIEHLRREVQKLQQRGLFRR